MEQNELEKAADLTAGHYFKIRGSNSWNDAVEIFKAGAEWQKEKQMRWVKASERRPNNSMFVNAKLRSGPCTVSFFEDGSGIETISGSLYGPEIFSKIEWLEEV